MQWQLTALERFRKQQSIVFGRERQLTMAMNVMLILQYGNVFHQLTTFDDISQFPFDPKERVKIVFHVFDLCVFFLSPCRL